MRRNRTEILAALALGLLAGCGDPTPRSEPEGFRSVAESSAPVVHAFTETSASLGLVTEAEPDGDGSYFMPESIGSGAALLDYDGDGDLDIYLIHGVGSGEAGDEPPGSANRLFQQGEDGSFRDVTDASGAGDRGYGMGAAAGDLDNDGDVDLYLTNYGPDKVYRNRGDGTFVDVSEEVGVDNPRWSCSVVLVDYDLDGWLDVYVANYVEHDGTTPCTDQAGRPDYCGPLAYSGSPDMLYRNREGAGFEDRSVASGIAAPSSKGLGVVAMDVLGDPHPELYVANDGEANHLWSFDSDGTFADEAFMSGAAFNELGQSEASMGVAYGDADNDGDFDIFLTHLRLETNTFYRNVGELGFRDDTSAAGLGGASLPFTGFGTAFLDFDQDRDLDLAVVNGRVTRGQLLAPAPGYWADYAEPNQLLENRGDGSFQSYGAGEPFETVVDNSRGLAVGDLDDDGDLDLLVTNRGAPARLYRNDLPSKGHWLLVRVFDPQLDRDALGSRVVVFAGGHTLVRHAAPGYSFLSSNDPRIHFGLGEVESVERIEVVWPGGERETFSGGPADRLVTLVRGEGEPGG